MTTVTPITEEQRYLLTQMASECCEVAHIITKALQFGLEETCPVKLKSNAERTNEEIVDLIATHQMLVERGVLPPIANKSLCEGLAAKKDKIQRYMDYALKGAPHPREAQRCVGCGNEIDPEVCGCGEAIDGRAHDGHSPIPMGCDCYRKSR